MAKEAQKDKEKKGLNLVILIPVLLLIAVGGSIGGTILTNHFLTGEKTASAETEKESSKISSEEAIVALDEFLVNLVKENGQEQQYMKVNLSILVADEDQSAEATKNVAVIRDSVVNLLRQQKASDILSAADSVPNLKKALKEAINKEYGSSIAKEVYVTDLVIQ
ncbi:MULTISPECIES: flagellar basal body-associated protein FliL [unclassified Enterococcus]|jgi:flagellar protein FliL|uniref:flagellar basal body-associated FliL family protein n=1 Tax=unclassified Enterococcus TaxID=2608891 RepID=UPI0006B8FF33|nr:MULTISPECIES: flagellar basal body-associated FliL family protein [unclassified Enterococcus]KPG68838.1 flagellar basal body-associated protein FliL [Enterococcus sp. RIT-PI-f]HCE13368.1 FliL domain-containing protein [Enterococcus sp.]